jgi:hypothetical protein
MAVMVASGTGVPSVPVTIPPIAEVVTPWAQRCRRSGNEQEQGQGPAVLDGRGAHRYPRVKAKALVESAHGTACRNYVKRVGIWPPP